MSGQQIHLVGSGERFGAAVHVQFAINVFRVPLDRVLRDEQPARDRCVGQASDIEAQYLDLTLGQRFGGFTGGG